MTTEIYQTDALIAKDIDAYLDKHQHKTMLRFITCGSVDDGKSTLIGRLLYDSKMIFEDQLASLEADSKRVGTQGQEIDFALLVDGLAAEREQGITIDVAYRFFATDARKFIVADTPGHEQYTRNMVTGASTADLAVILIDARKGVLTQTRRHSYLAHLVGIRNFVLAVNKMDLVDYDQARFERIVADYREFADQIGIGPFQAIPISGLKGDNITTAGPNGGPDEDRATPWYRGPTLLAYLETVELDQGRLLERPFRMAVQWVNRPNLDFRGFSGQIASGCIKPGDAVRILPGNTASVVRRIVTMDGDLAQARAGQSVTLTLADEIDCSRGQVIAAADQAAGCRRPVRGDHRLDGGRADDRQSRLCHEACYHAGHRHHHQHQVQHQRQHHGPRAQQDTGAERHRRMQYRHQQGDRVRALRATVRTLAVSS
jgi:bifunctional enzyme CysN/CysC